MTNRIETIADRIVADWIARVPHANLSGVNTPRDIADAYAIQQAVQTRLTGHRGPLVGRKIALSSRAMQQMVGIDHPIAGAFFANDIHRSPAEIPASGFRHLGVECELAIEIARDCRSGRVHDVDSVRELVSAVRPAFELIEDRNADYDALDVLSLVADNAWCGGVVLGPVLDVQPDEIANLRGAISETGQPDEATETGAADPLGSLAWVLTHADSLGTPARKGEIVITGSATRTRFPCQGTRLTYSVSGVEVALVVV